MYDKIMDAQRSVSEFIYRVYAWMMTGLLVTAGTAYMVFSNVQVFTYLISHRWVFLSFLCAPIALSVYLSWRIKTMHYGSAIAAFLLYAFLIGVNFSIFFAAYDMTSLISCFSIAGSMFGIMAVYGYFTHSDLTKFGNLMIMVLTGLVVAKLINLWFQSSAASLTLSFISVLVFSGLTAYRMQRIKHLGYELVFDEDYAKRFAILGALSLYLSFINLFLALLQLLGRRRG